ncbi:MAG: hypothetical protein WDO69_02180 [Pseudomonadota bacterium]
MRAETKEAESLLEIADFWRIRGDTRKRVALRAQGMSSELRKDPTQ